MSSESAGFLMVTGWCKLLVTLLIVVFILLFLLLLQANLLVDWVTEKVYQRQLFSRLFTLCDLNNNVYLY